MSHPLAIILIGPQGSGKGTQATTLVHKHRYLYIAGGDIARRLSRQKSHLGQEVHQLMDEGKLLPDRILNHGIQAVIKASDHRSILFDGYPRTISQAEFIYPLLLEIGFRVVVIHLELDDTECIKRIAGRLICSKCGSVIYPKNQVSKKVLHIIRGLRGRCYHCGGNLIQRSDDTEDAVKERLSLYHKETRAVIEFFKKKHCLHVVDATPSAEEISAAIETIIKSVTY